MARLRDSTLRSAHAAQDACRPDNSTEPAQRPLTWTIRFSVPGDNNLYFKSCDGTLTLVQSGSTFTGTLAQSGGNNCPSVSGQVVEVSYSPTGTITFSLAGPASDPLSWTMFTHCTAVTPGTMSFSGTVNGDHMIEATFAQDALMQCPTEGTVSTYVRLRAPASNPLAGARNLAPRGPSGVWSELPACFVRESCHDLIA